MIDIEIRKERLAICNECEHSLDTGHCAQCYCAISSLTANPNSRCPLLFWGRVQ
jgi:hypothetical protein